MSNEPGWDGLYICLDCGKGISKHMAESYQGRCVPCYKTACPTEYRHFENERYCATLIKNVSPEEMDANIGKLEELRKRGLVVDMGDGIEFGLTGFTTLNDTDGKPAFHFKFRGDINLGLYLTTDHPESQELLEAFKKGAERAGFEIRHMRDVIKENIELHKKAMSGELETGKGIHPQMTELKKNREKKGFL